jgi:hypothetical protein
MEKNTISEELMIKIISTIVYHLKQDTEITGNPRLQFVIDRDNVIAYSLNDKRFILKDVNNNIKNGNFNLTIGEFIEYLQNFTEPTLIEAYNTYKHYAYVLYSKIDAMVYADKLTALLGAMQNSDKNVSIKLQVGKQGKEFIISYNSRLGEYVYTDGYDNIPKKFFLSGIPNILQRADANMVRKAMDKLYNDLGKPDLTKVRNQPEEIIYQQVQQKNNDTDIQQLFADIRAQQEENEKFDYDEELNL